MKFLFLLLFVTTTAIGQKAITYEDVIDTKTNLTKNEMFERGQEWVLSIFNNPENVIQVEDKDDGRIIIKASFPYQQKKTIWGGQDTTEGQVYFTMKILFKEGRYKYIISDFTHQPYRGNKSFGLITTAKDPHKIPFTGKKWRGWIWDDLKEQIDINANAIIISIFDAMHKETRSNDDW